MTARAGAIDELMASGALEDTTGSTKDSLTRELEEMASASDVDNQLAALQAEIGGAEIESGSEQGAIGSGDKPADPASGSGS